MTMLSAPMPSSPKPRPSVPVEAPVMHSPVFRVAPPVWCVLSIAWSIVGGTFNWFGNDTAAAWAWSVSGLCAALLVLEGFAVWASTKQPLLECSRCSGLQEASDLTLVGTAPDRRLCPDCLQPPPREAA